MIKQKKVKKFYKDSTLKASLFALLFSISACTDPGALGFLQTEIIPLTRDHAHGSTIVELPNGDLLAAWFQGSGERWADDVQILGARLTREVMHGVNPSQWPMSLIFRISILYYFWILKNSSGWSGTPSLPTSGPPPFPPTESVLIICRRAVLPNGSGKRYCLSNPEIKLNGECIPMINL